MFILFCLYVWPHWTIVQIQIQVLPRRSRVLILFVQTIYTFCFRLSKVVQKGTWKCDGDGDGDNDSTTITKNSGTAKTLF